MRSSLFCDFHEKIILLFTIVHLYSLTDKTNSEIEGQSCTWFHQLARIKRNRAWRGGRRRINSAKAILLKPEASVEAIQGLRQRIPYMWDDPPGSPSTSAVSLYYCLIFLSELNKSLVGPYAESCMCVCLSMEVNHVVEQGGNIISVMA